MPNNDDDDDVTGRGIKVKIVKNSLLAAVHFAVMAQGICEDGSRQTEWHHKLAFEML